MSNWSPQPVSTPVLVIGVSAYVLVLGYSLLIAGQFLLGVLAGLLLAVIYLLWRFLAAVEAIAEATHRLADQRGGDAPAGNADDTYEDEASTG